MGLSRGDSMFLMVLSCLRNFIVCMSIEGISGDTPSIFWIPRGGFSRCIEGVPLEDLTSGGAHFDILLFFPIFDIDIFSSLSLGVISLAVTSSHWPVCIVSLQDQLVHSYFSMA